MQQEAECMRLGGESVADKMLGPTVGQKGQGKRGLRRSMLTTACPCSMQQNKQLPRPHRLLLLLSTLPPPPKHRLAPSPCWHRAAR